MKNYTEDVWTLRVMCAHMAGRTYNLNVSQEENPNYYHLLLYLCFPSMVVMSEVATKCHLLVKNCATPTPPLFLFKCISCWTYKATAAVTNCCPSNFEISK